MPQAVSGVNPEPQLVRSPQRTTMGRSESFTMATRGEIPALWVRFAGEAGDLLAKRPSYGISYNVEGDTFQYMCALEAADDLPAGWDKLELPEGRYLAYTFTGHVSGITAAFDAIFGKLLPEAKIAPDPRPVIEVYDERFDGRTGSGVIEIWVPATE
jgi:AraC family transcriptional regulator